MTTATPRSGDEAGDDEDRRPTRRSSSRPTCAARRATGTSIHSYAGYENRVKANLENRIASLNMEDYIFQVEVPMEEVTEIKNGQRKQVRRVRIPGYVLVRMDLTDESWGAVRHTPGVTGFVGHTHQPVAAEPRRGLLDAGPDAWSARTKPRPQAAAEVKVVDFEVGESVTVMEGPFETLPGDDLRDQRRRPEAQGARVDLRPRDPGRAVVQPGRQDLSAAPSRPPRTDRREHQHQT